MKKKKIVTVDRFEKYAEIEELYTSKFKKVELVIPSNFRMLCAILNIKAESVLNDFMKMMSYSHHNTATDKQRNTAREFFMSCEYGQPGYSVEHIDQMLEELKAKRLIYDTIDGMEREDLELFWRNNHMYMQHWFKRWFEQKRRKEDISILAEF